MNYIVFDLEFNQALSPGKENKSSTPPNLTFEIIQIGAVKLDKNLAVVSNFNTLIKPEVHINLHPYIKEMTGITEEQLSTGKPFKEAYTEFMDFIESDKTILCTWGTGDMRELFRNVEYHGFNTSSIPKKYINLQSYATKYLNYSKGLNVGLRNAVELLDIPITFGFHDAFNDAFYTAEIFRRIYNKRIKYTTYNHSHNAPIRAAKVKQIIDTDSLIRQFEKMFNREMSSEEKSIIEKAYIMGKTGQFLMEDSSKEK
jgi:DNA polymerase III epsilon subunit-like protein